MPFLPLTLPIYPDLGPAPKPAGLQVPVVGLSAVHKYEYEIVRQGDLYKCYVITMWSAWD